MICTVSRQVWDLSAKKTRIVCVEKNGCNIVSKGSFHGLNFSVEFGFLPPPLRLLRFSLDCEVPTRSAGISVSLLSVCLATLMALFRDPDLATKVSKEHLALLIRETGTALLDSRLVVSSQGSSLDEATSTQVVRAINKVMKDF